MRSLTIDTALSQRLGITVPIMQAGMAAIARPRLVASVSEAGGLGVLGGGSVAPDVLRDEIREIRHLTDRPFGVDLVVPAALAADSTAAHAEVRRLLDDVDEETRLGLSDLLVMTEPGMIDAQMQVLVEEGVPVLVAAMGSPGRWVPMLHDAGVFVFALAGTLRHAERLVEHGVDAVIATGSEAGGHTGSVGSLSLWNACVRTLPVPVVAAGGVVDGATLAAALVLGCQAAWMGTRFFGCLESDAHPAAKERLRSVRPEDCVITRAYSGKTMRVVRNDYVQRWEGRDAEVLPFPQQQIVAGGRARAGLLRGDVDEGAIIAGQGAGAIDDIPSAAHIIEALVRDASALLAGTQPSDRG